MVARTSFRRRGDDGHALVAAALRSGCSQLIQQARYTRQDNERLLAASQELTGDVNDAKLEALNLYLPARGRAQQPAWGSVNGIPGDQPGTGYRQRRVVHLGQPLAERHMRLHTVSFCTKKS